MEIPLSQMPYPDTARRSSSELTTMLVALPWLGAPAVPSWVLQPTAGSLSTAPPCASDATFLECIGAVVALDNSTSDRYVTIGAHTADEDFDPLYQTLRQTAWTGLLVEPEPHLYSILTSKQRPGFEYERVAVGAPDEAGKNITFYTVSDDIDPYTGVDKRSGKAFPTGVAGGINSLNLSHLLKHSYYWTERGLKIDDYIVPISVPCVAASWLLTKHELSAPSFRLLLVDTEGTRAPRRKVESLHRLTEFWLPICGYPAHGTSCSAAHAS